MLRIRCPHGNIICTESLFFELREAESKQGWSIYGLTNQGATFRLFDWMPKEEAQSLLDKLWEKLSNSVYVLDLIEMQKIVSDLNKTQKTKAQNTETFLPESSNLESRVDAHI